MEKKNVAVFVLIFVIIALGLWFLTPKWYPVVSVKAGGAGPGWVNLTLMANFDVKSAQVKLARSANLVSCSNNSCVFSYWVSPTDESGNYTARVLVVDKNNHTYTFKIPMFIKNNATYTRVGNVVFYGGNLTSTLNSFKNNTISIIAKFTDGESVENGAVVKAEVVIIAGLSAMNKTVNFYASSPSNCTFTVPGKGVSVSLSPDKCSAVEGTKIIIEQPIYPTDQVYVNGTTLVIQGNVETLNKLSADTMYILARYLKHGTLT